VEPAADDPGAWSCAANALPPGQTAKFRLERRGKVVEGFVINVNGSHHAYVNCCPHAGTPLDLWPNEFLTEDGRHLICATHGAIFDPRSGLCVEGPCPGATLEPLVVETHGPRLVVRCRT
jgi:nitrite reductase/ring-hydroxylating ferredoxin subunit